MHVYLNGQIIPEENAKISVLDRGFLYGDGVFETMRVDDGKVWWLADHQQRLQDALKALDIGSVDAPLAFHSIPDLLEKNNLIKGPVALRLSVSRGQQSERGLWPARAINPTVTMVAMAYQPVDKMMRLGIYPTGLGPSHSLKSLSYLDSILLMRFAVENGFDDAVKIDSDRRILETATANLFFIQEDQIITPPASGILPGIARKQVIQIAAQNNLAVDEKEVYIDQLGSMQACFTTNVLQGIRSVQAIGEIKFQDHLILSTLKKLWPYT